MAKARVRFVCQQCGAGFPKWTGKCENCGVWNSLVEQLPVAEGKSVIARSQGQKLTAAKIKDIKIDTVADRIPSGFDDLDAVLGGGLMPGGVVLLAGQPGIGKSTLLMQICAKIADKNAVLYVSGEESASQVKLRAERLGAKNNENLDLASSVSADDVATTILDGKYKLVVVDSMQTMQMAEIASAPGTVSQITNSANIIIRAAKSTDTAVVLVGHVTKEGSIAGPKVLEHIVDVVLEFQGDKYGGFKLVRAQKNRYGSTTEVAIFDMKDTGLELVKNPSEALLAERRDTDGSVILATLEGNRPLLVEIQALVNPTSFGYPNRTASGFDLNRLKLLIAVLERRTKLKLEDKDIYVNVVGGLRLDDSAADLAVAMAIASAAAERKLATGAVCFGEIGLGGEIRSARLVDKRIAEAKKLGFKFAIAPKSAARDKFVVPATDLRDALNQHLK
ncbi:MAG: DNA repair protein RadA [Candidatus Nomurabacteria bacterium]|jgi:DNA repair protein RadA/Sms|nr:DNA repair protein RadA [Candidatus Nomurabacteria bacterium]